MRNAISLPGTVGVGGRAPDVRVAHIPDGTDFPIDRLWRGHSAVLVFLRHLG